MRNNNYRIALIHICSFTREKNNLLCSNIHKYPERLCVIDEENDIAIDVETNHAYRYVRVINSVYFKTQAEKYKVQLGKRVACIEQRLDLTLFDSNTLKRCEQIIDLLKKGYVFDDGNKKLTNDEYLKIANISKEKLKIKKIYKKRK